MSSDQLELLPSSGPAPAQLAWLSFILTKNQLTPWPAHPGQVRFLIILSMDLSQILFLIPIDKYLAICQTLPNQTKPQYFLGLKWFKSYPIYAGTFDYCQAQAQLQLSWPGLALFSQKTNSQTKPNLHIFLGPKRYDKSLLSILKIN